MEEIIAFDDHFEIKSDKKERGTCGECKHYSFYSDTTYKCAFYGSMPRNSCPDKLCDIDNGTKYGFEKKCEGIGEVISVTLIPAEEPNEHGKNKDFVEAMKKGISVCFGNPEDEKSFILRKGKYQPIIKY